jgi:hypothetical protein
MEEIKRLKAEQVQVVSMLEDNYTRLLKETKLEYKLQIDDIKSRAMERLTEHKLNLYKLQEASKKEIVEATSALEEAQKRIKVLNLEKNELIIQHDQEEKKLLREYQVIF